MWLAQWMRDNEWTEDRFGDHIGVSGAYVNRLKSGQNFPGTRIRRKIFEATGGQVTANDLAEAHDAFKGLQPQTPPVLRQAQDEGVLEPAR